MGAPYPYTDIPYQELPADSQARFGRDFFRNISELQVGYAGNELNPKVMRVDRSGMWLGQKSFIQPLSPEPTPTGILRFQVDMFGNVSAVSFKTAFSGERIRIFNNRLESYDATSPDPRVVLDSESLNFYNDVGTLNGSIFTANAGSNDFRISATQDILALNAQNSISTFTGGIITANFNFATANAGGQLFTVFIGQLVLPLFPADPSPTSAGSMYYNTITDEVRVFKGGTWRDVITT